VFAWNIYQDCLASLDVDGASHEALAHPSEPIWLSGSSKKKKLAIVEIEADVVEDPNSLFSSVPCSARQSSLLS
jgi:hypothetical protein